MALLFSDILGQENALEKIGRALERDRLPEALLFSGTEGTGKRSAAMALARRLLCERPDGPDGCGGCGPCRRVDAGSHPDLHLLEPEGNFVKIEPMRELIAALRLRAYEGKWKIGIIDGAERMSPNTANAFLKTLEEPSGRTLFVLVAVNKSRLPPTIASRCQRIHFAPLDEKTIASLLREKHGIGQERSAVLAALSEGSPGRALRLEEEDLIGLRDAVIEGLEGLSRDRPAAALRTAEKLAKLPAGEWESERMRLSRLIAMLRLGLRDVFLLQQGIPESGLANRDIAGRIRRLAGRIPPDATGRALDSLDAWEASLERNYNARLVLEDLLLEAGSFANPSG